MHALLPILILLGALAVVLGCFVWLAARMRRRDLAGGAASAALASYEEVFRATAHQAHYEIRAQTERKAPALSPAGHGRLLLDGTNRPSDGDRPHRVRRGRRSVRGLARRSRRWRHGR
ncbi:hypothetical protein AB0N87_27720 [Streptomyces sp. NPDC093228]|uniref:hypothetical protein n=1 Tax=unclassified Streptomyces TaxID=2593676 RepID=UPI000E2766DB|nr:MULTISPECIES: hypothetical protein [unclassified Streptomyces]MDX3260003.1 hypothetical protein [Streptomyces sp. MI02-2A]